MAESRPLSSPDIAASGSLPSGPVSVSSPVPVGGTDQPVTLQNPRSCPTCGGRYPADFKVCPHDATRLEDAPADSGDPLLGQQLAGMYEILRVIGEGGMGRVYEARHTRLSKKRFAVKLLHHELARQPEVVTRFQREAEAASALGHPNVVTVVDVNATADGRPYLVAELLEGDQLGDYLDRVQRLPAGEAVRIARQVCRALTAAHAIGIVHRDVKPENVFLTQGSELVKVLDFGISKLGESAEALTKTGVVMGTPDYMAPEQARGDRVDARADIYAVGAILYRALTGHKPFEGLDTMATLTAVLVQQPARPSVLQADIPLGLELVVQRAMAKRPDERYQTMLELDEALAPFEDASRRITFQASTELGAGREKTRLVGRDLTPAGLASTRDVSTAQLARPALLLFSAIGLLWCSSSAVAGATALLRLVRGVELTETEGVLVPLVVVAGLATPVALYVRHLRRDVWPNTPRSIDVVALIRSMVLYSAAAYGFAASFTVLLETVIRRDGAGLARPAWALISFGFAAAVAFATWLASRAQR